MLFTNQKTKLYKFEYVIFNLYNGVVKHIFYLSIAFKKWNVCTLLNYIEADKSMNYYINHSYLYSKFHNKNTLTIPTVNFSLLCI
jgi:hypothetical protein